MSFEAIMSKYRVTVALSSHKEHPRDHDSLRLINHSVYLIGYTNQRRRYKHLDAEQYVVGATRGEKSTCHKLNYSGSGVGNQLCQPFRWKRSD